MPDGGIEARTAAVERLLTIFRLERLVYLSVTSIVFFIALGAGTAMVYHHGADSTSLTLVFGSSGITGYSANRILKMFNDALSMIAGSN